MKGGEGGADLEGGGGRQDAELSAPLAGLLVGALEAGVLFKQKADNRTQKEIISSSEKRCVPDCYLHC